ncbi:hydrolase [Neosynechococcus sphagnicola sy1]|uniref:Hydrolase n=1 Tax=Neosynechococcus sphagnicola sy1 TaxID=1497020 RepID=A0A098TP06_9CYAN|nr:hydrolase [Neosynechococcus sphagnicola sy1]
MAIAEYKVQVGSLQWFYREVIPETPNGRSPVLLLHGLPSQSYSWREILPELGKQGFRAIAPDWIGFGYSDWPEPQDFAYTPEAFIEALTAFLGVLELSRFSLVVQGFLGSVGLQYGLRHPDQIERLVILNTPITPTAKLPWKIKQLGLPLIGDMLTQDPLLVDRTLEGGGPYQVQNAALDVYRRPFLTSSSAGRALLATVRHLQLATAMAEITAGFTHWQQPTLLVWGLQDPWLPLSMAQQVASGLAGGEIVTLDQVGHYPQEDWPEQVHGALIPFLRRANF